MESLVSIIIPAFNVEKYLCTCINSVIQQTYKKLEIILIDDGSTDKSGEICDSYSEKDKRIVTYHKKNEGLGITRNFGIQHSNGNYIVFLDADDYIEPQMIEVLLKESIENKADLCIGGYYRVSDDNSTIASVSYQKETFEGEQLKNELLPRMIGDLPESNDNIYAMVWGKMYSADSIKKNNIYFQSERKVQAEDIAFQLDYIPHIRKAIIVQECYYCYRNNPLSLSKRYKENRFQQTLDFYNYVVERVHLLRLPSNTLVRVAGMFLVQTQQCLKQELPKYSQNSFRLCYKKIRQLIRNNTLQNVLNSYPINNLKLKERIYCNLLKDKQAWLLIAGFEVLTLKDKGK